MNNFTRNTTLVTGTKCIIIATFPGLENPISQFPYISLRYFCNHLCLFKQNIPEKSGLNHMGAVVQARTTIQIRQQTNNKSSCCCFFSIALANVHFSPSVLRPLCYSKVTRCALERMYSRALHKSQQLSANWLLEKHEARALLPVPHPLFIKQP